MKKLTLLLCLFACICIKFSSGDFIDVYWETCSSNYDCSYNSTFNATIPPQEFLYVRTEDMSTISLASSTGFYFAISSLSAYGSINVYVQTEDEISNVDQYITYVSSVCAENYTCYFNDDDDGDDEGDDDDGAAASFCSLNQTGIYYLTIFNNGYSEVNVTGNILLQDICAPSTKVYRWFLYIFVAPTGFLICFLCACCIACRRRIRNRRLRYCHIPETHCTTVVSINDINNNNYSEAPPKYSEVNQSYNIKPIPSGSSNYSTFHNYQQGPPPPYTNLPPSSFSPSSSPIYPQYSLTEHSYQQPPPSSL